LEQVAAGPDADSSGAVLGIYVLVVLVLLVLPLILFGVERIVWMAGLSTAGRTNRRRSSSRARA
jgi:hypothetical protein